MIWKMDTEEIHAVSIWCGSFVCLDARIRRQLLQDEATITDSTFPKASFVDRVGLFRIPVITSSIRTSCLVPSASPSPPTPAAARDSRSLCKTAAQCIWVGECVIRKVDKSTMRRKRDWKRGISHSLQVLALRKSPHLQR